MNARLLLLVTAIALSTGASVATEFPRSGVADMPNGVSEPFAGTWAMGFPSTPGTIVAETIHDCAAPVVLSVVDAATLHYASPAGGDSSFELSAFEGRTSWFPADGGPSSIAVWTGRDSFNLHRVGPTGSADWDNPFELVRCP